MSQMPLQLALLRRRYYALFVFSAALIDVRYVTQFIKDTPSETATIKLTSPLNLLSNAWAILWSLEVTSS